MCINLALSIRTNFATVDTNAVRKPPLLIPQTVMGHKN
jgi:hypothetical protein